ncbi:MAG: extracellular solute-binding protein [Deltaproteobacteria bacterium]|nr:extracellular solute-binding protein [Deltaproteobacteria bacterium]
MQFQRNMWLVVVLAVTVIFIPTSEVFGQGGGSGWKTDWNKTLAAAKKEGKLAFVSGSSSRDYIGKFRKAFPDIQVEFLEMRASDLQVRIPTERRAGVYQWDIIVMGGSAGVTDFVPAGIFADLNEALIRPEFKKNETWVGDFEDIWVDNRRKKFKIHHKAGLGQGASFWVNRKQVPESKLNKTDDLFNPEFKGKICTFDPRVEGAADAQFGMIAVMYGKEYLRRLFKETNMVIIRNYRKLTEDTIRGRCLIAVGGRITNFHKRGVGLHIKRFYAFSPTIASEFKDVVEFTCCGKGKTGKKLDGFFAGGSAHNMLSMASRAPHPNAAKVFVNWVLSKEGQMAWMKDDETQCSRRADLHTTWCVDYLNQKDPTQFIPLKENGTYISLHTTSNVQHRYTSHRIGTEVFGR